MVPYLNIILFLHSIRINLQSERHILFCVWISSSSCRFTTLWTSFTNHHYHSHVNTPRFLKCYPCWVRRPSDVQKLTALVQNPWHNSHRYIKSPFRHLHVSLSNKLLSTSVSFNEMMMWSVRINDDMTRRSSIFFIIFLLHRSRVAKEKVNFQSHSQFQIHSVSSSPTHLSSSIVFAVWGNDYTSTKL